MIERKKLFYVQDCVKKMLVTANIYYIDIARKYIYFIIINIYNYIFKYLLNFIYIRLSQMLFVLLNTYFISYY